jgi:hypothetical protein
MSVVLDCLEKAIQIVADTDLKRCDLRVTVWCFVVVRYDAHS